MINGWRDGPRCIGALRQAQDRHGAWAGPFGVAQGRPFGCMVGRAGERWKGEVARERQTGGRFTAVAVVRRER